MQVRRLRYPLSADRWYGAHQPFTRMYQHSRSKTRENACCQLSCIGLPICCKASLRYCQISCLKPCKISCHGLEVVCISSILGTSFVRVCLGGILQLHMLPLIMQDGASLINDKPPYLIPRFSRRAAANCHKAIFFRGKDRCNPGVFLSGCSQERRLPRASHAPQCYHCTDQTITACYSSDPFCNA